MPINLSPNYEFTTTYRAKKVKKSKPMSGMRRKMHERMLAIFAKPLTR